MSLLDVLDLKVHFPLRGRLFGGRGLVRAVDGVGFRIEPGETLGLVGESDCGKTTVARAVMRLIDPTSGRVVFEGRDLATLRGADLKASRSRLQMVFQDPSGSLNPRMTVRMAVEEPLRIHRVGLDSSARTARCAELMASVGLDAGMADRYPHEFSGGQRQRVGIARALALDPKLLICDEPVSALDVSVQAQIVNLLRDLQERLGMACLFVAHDLAVVRHLSHRVAVMYLGRIVETGPARAVIDRPGHPYTRSLLEAVPGRKRGPAARRTVLPKEMPSPLNPPPGCPFHPRCPLAQERCKSEIPAPREIAPERQAACHFAEVV